MPYPLAPRPPSCSPIPHLSGPIPALLYLFSHPCNYLPAPLSLQSLSLLLHPCSSIPVFPYTTCMPFSPAPLPRPAPLSLILVAPSLLSYTFSPIPATICLLLCPCNLYPCSFTPVLPSLFSRTLHVCPFLQPHSLSPPPHLCSPMPAPLQLYAFSSIPATPLLLLLPCSLYPCPSSSVLPSLLPYPSLLSLPPCPCSQVILATPFLLLCTSISIPATPFLFPSLLPHSCSSSLFLIHTQGCQK